MRVVNRLPLLFHITVVESKLPVRILFPSGENFAAVTPPVCSPMVSGLSPAMVHIEAVLSQMASTRNWLSGDFRGLTSLHLV